MCRCVAKRQSLSHSPISKSSSVPPALHFGRLTRKAVSFTMQSTLHLGGSNEHLTRQQAALTGPSDIQSIRSIGNDGCSRGCRVAGVALAGAQERDHAPGTLGVI